MGEGVGLAGSRTGDDQQRAGITRMAGSILGCSALGRAERRPPNRFTALVSCLGACCAGGARLGNANFQFGTSRGLITDSENKTKMLTAAQAAGQRAPRRPCDRLGRPRVPWVKHQ